MEYYSSHINKLIEQLSHLPGIGAKSAQRLAFHIMNMPKDQVDQLTSSIVNARENVQYCKCCYTLTDREICPICSNDKRDHSVIMVVENTRDLAAYEKTGKFDGVYHVLHGAISPMLGVGPDDIKLKELMQRLTKDDVKEVNNGYECGMSFVNYNDIKEAIEAQKKMYDVSYFGQTDENLDAENQAMAKKMGLIKDETTAEQEKAAAIEKTT